jgi:hypothetical protein
MSSFQAVNTTLTVPGPPPARSGEETTPTTPRPDARFAKDAKGGEEPRTEDSSLKTPTRNSFIGIAGQRPLPSSPFTPSRELSETPSTKSNLSRGQSYISTVGRYSRRRADGRGRGRRRQRRIRHRERDQRKWPTVKEKERSALLLYRVSSV